MDRFLNLPNRLRNMARQIQTGAYLNQPETARQLRELADVVEALLKQAGGSKVDPGRP